MIKNPEAWGAILTQTNEGGKHFVLPTPAGNSKPKRSIIHPSSLRCRSPSQALKNPPHNQLQFRNCTMLTILILFSTFPTAHNNQVVFKEFQKMTGAISNMHIIIPINISGLKAQADQYNLNIRDFMKEIKARYFCCINEHYATEYTK
jgi:hypothetical protein